MARISEFHIPADFKPIIKCVPQGERGRLVVFLSNLKSRREIGPFSISRMVSANEHTSRVGGVITGVSSAIGIVQADRLGLDRHQNTT
jgi:hypothetical protein